MILPVKGVTSSANKHNFIPYIYIYVLRTLRVNLKLNNYIQFTTKAFHY